MVSPSDDASDDKQVSKAQCCGDHEDKFGAGKPCDGVNWRCILLKVIDKWLKEQE